MFFREGMEITIAPDGHDEDDVEKESEDFQPACHSTTCIYIYIMQWKKSQIINKPQTEIHTFFLWLFHFE